MIQKHEEGPISTAGNKPLPISRWLCLPGEVQGYNPIYFIDSCRVNDFTNIVSYLIYNPKRASRGKGLPHGPLSEL